MRPTISRYHGNVKAAAVEASHDSSCFILLNLSLDLLPMSAVEGPGIGQILGPKSRIRPQELGLARPQSPRLDQQPDRNPGPNDARVAAADLRIGLDTRVAVSKIAHNPLKKLRFLSRSHLGEQPLGFLKLGHRRSSRTGIRYHHMPVGA